MDADINADINKDQDRDRFGRQLEFILEADREKNILRQTHLTGHGRRENDAEHAWHMALMIWLLREYANEPFDAARAMMMALIHDIVEIDAGDTYAYDEAGLATQKERENRAADRLFGLLPPDQGTELRELFEEFEAGETPEARFVRSMDNLQPLLLNRANEGADWAAHGVRLSQILRRHASTRKGSDFLGAWSLDVIREHVARGNITDDTGD